MFQIKNITLRVIAAGIRPFGICITIFIVLSTLSIAQTWTYQNAPPKARNVNDIAISNDGQTLYACDKSVLFKSINGGSAWVATGVEIASPLVVTCKPDVPNVVVVGISGSLQRNANGGSTGIWEPVLTQSNMLPLRLSVSTLITDQMYLGRKYVNGASSIMRSGTGGASWSNPTIPPGPTDLYGVAPYPVTGTRSNHVWACGSDPSGGSNESGDPNTTTASVRGVWQSTNNGDIWTQKNMGNFNVRAIAIADQTTPFVYAGTSTGKLYRSDYGAGWTQKSSYQTTSTATTVSAIRVRTDNNFVFVASDKGIHRSTNSGNDWSNVSPDLYDKNILTFSIAGSNQNLMYATTNNTVWKTTNGGTDWTKVDNGLGRMPLSSIAISGNNYWTVSASYDSLGYYNGTQWSITELSNFRGEHIIRNNSSLFAAGLINPSNPQAALYRSSDNGATYSAWYVSSTQGYGNIFKGSAIDPLNSDYTYVWGKDGTNNMYHIYSATSRDGHVVGNSSNSINDVVWATASGPTYFAKDNEGVLKCDGVTPCVGTQVLNTTTVKDLVVNSAVPNTVYSAGASGLWKTVNAGVNWTQVRTDALKRVVQSPGFPNSANYVAVVANDGSKIYYSGNGGTSWVDQTGTIPTPIYELRSEPGNTTTLCAATDNGIYKINTLSQAPTLVYPSSGAANQPLTVTLSWNSVPEAAGYHVVVDDDPNFGSPAVNNPFVIPTLLTMSGLANGKTYYWKVLANNVVGDGPASTSWTFTTIGSITLTWTSSNAEGDPCNFKTSDCHPMLVWTTNGSFSSYNVYRYACAYGAGDCGATPSLLISGTMDQYFVDVTVWVKRPGETAYTTFYYYVTSNSGPLVTSNKVTVNSNQVNKLTTVKNLPIETKLGLNYPNPFNPTTTIKYSLREDTYIKLTVYDILGREVARLIDGEETAGYKSVLFDACNLPSGVYFYRLSAGKVTQVMKMLLAK
jgi:photosystem II stability/assembly factor-like uncharacterized protein